MTEDELKAVVTHEFEDANLAFVRDIFVFVCFTALSFIDVKELTTENIMDINGDKWIIGHRHKTGIPFQVKLMDVPLQIIDRYKHLQEDKLVFGKMTYSPTLVLRPHCVALSVRSYTTSLPLMTSMRMSIFLLNFYKRTDAFYILWLIVSLMLDLRVC